MMMAFYIVITRYYEKRAVSHLTLLGGIYVYPYSNAIISNQHAGYEQNLQCQCLEVTNLAKYFHSDKDK